MSSDELIKRKLDCPAIGAAAQPQGDSDVIGRIARIELIEDPKPLLRVRDGQRLITVGSFKCWQGGDTASSWLPFDDFGERRDCGRLE